MSDRELQAGMREFVSGGAADLDLQQLLKIKRTAEAAIAEQAAEEIGSAGFWVELEDWDSTRTKHFVSRVDLKEKLGDGQAVVYLACGPVHRTPFPLLPLPHVNPADAVCKLCLKAAAL